VNRHFKCSTVLPDCYRKYLTVTKFKTPV